MEDTHADPAVLAPPDETPLPTGGTELDKRSPDKRRPRDQGRKGGKRAEERGVDAERGEAAAPDSRSSQPRSPQAKGPQPKDPQAKRSRIKNPHTKSADGRHDDAAGEAGRDAARRARPPGAKSVGWALVQAARLHRARVGDRLAGLGLFAGQEQVVQALAVAGSMTMGDLAATLRVRPPTASKTITRLAALGFVERRAEAGDGRVVRVRLTEAGLAKAAAIERIWDEVEAELLDGFENKERRRLRKLLRKVARTLARAAGVTGQETEADAEIEAEDDEGEALIGPLASDAVARPD